MRRLITVLILITAGLAIPVYAQTLRDAYNSYTKQNAPVLLANYRPLSIPTRTIVAASPTLTSASVTAYAVDAATMTPLYAQNETTPRPIASVTKLMTLLVVLSGHKLSDTVTIGQLPAYDQADELLGLVPGQVFSVGDLAAAALVASANDAADALASYDAGNEAAFIKKMNIRAAEWGINGAHFGSATGLTDQDNLVSAVALAKIAKLALVNPTITSLVKLPSATIADHAGRSYTLKTTDDLLATGQFYGIKTGYTDAAGQCFVGLTRINGHNIITVVLGSSDRFGDTTRLANWIQGAWQWQ